MPKSLIKENVWNFALKENIQIMSKFVSNAPILVQNVLHSIIALNVNQELFSLEANVQIWDAPRVPGQIKLKICPK